MNYPYMSEEAKRWLAGKGEYRLTTVPYQVAGGWLWAFIMTPVLVAVITSIPGLTGTGFGLGLGASMVFALSFPPILKRVRRESAESAGSASQSSKSGSGSRSSKGQSRSQGSGSASASQGAEGASRGSGSDAGTSRSQSEASDKSPGQSEAGEDSETSE